MNRYTAVQYVFVIGKVWIILNEAYFKALIINFLNFAL